MRLVLDVHVPAAVAAQLRRSNIEAESLAEWRNGIYREANDLEILFAARADSCVFVTYDSRTFPNLLAALALEGESHAGVILIDELTIRPSDIGGLVRALGRVVEEQGADTWTERVIYLTRT